MNVFLFIDRHGEPTKSTQSQNIVAVKIFLAITCVYIFSFVPPIIVYSDIYSNFHLVYISSFKSISNFFILYGINVNFRKDVNELFGFK